MSTERARRRFMQRTSSPAVNFSFIDLSGMALPPPSARHYRCDRLSAIDLLQRFGIPDSSASVRTAVEWRMRLLQTVYRDVAAIDPVGARRRGEQDRVR